MRTKKEVREFLEGLQWCRMTKKELEKKLQVFFGCDNKIDNMTCEDCKDIDYSVGFTTEVDEYNDDIYDVEIWYLNMRKKNHILITGTEILISPVNFS